MTRKDRKKLEALLEGLDALEAARAVARPANELAGLLSPQERSRLVVDVFESRAHGDEKRREGGVFYTPSEVVDAMLERLPLDGTLLDPACGAGAFALGLVRRCGPEVLERFWACDIDARALDACALALEAALPGDEQRVRRWRRERAIVGDFLRDALPLPVPDTVLGNPPYRVSGETDLPRLFPRLSGELDLYACFLLRSLERVKRGGSVGLLVPDTWLTNRRSHSLRELLLEAGLARIVDFGKPFASARDTRVHAVVLRAGSNECQVESLREGVLEEMASVSREQLGKSLERGWALYRTSAEQRACEAMERGGRPLHERFEVIYGLRTGNNRAHVGQGPGAVSLVGGADIAAFDRKPSTKHLLEPSLFPRQLSQQLGRMKLGVQRIRTNSAVSWRRWIEAAPVRADEVGLDSLTLLARRGGDETLDDETCSLLGVLCSSLFNRWYRLSFTDVNVKPAYLREVPVPPSSPALAALVRRRLESGEDPGLERAVDRLVAEAYGLDEEAVRVLEQGYWGEELAHRPMPSLAERLQRSTL